MAPLSIVFAGTSEFAATILRALVEGRHRMLAVITQPDRPAGRGRRLRASPVKTLAASLDIPVQQPPSLRDPQVQKAALSPCPDLIVVAAYGLMLPPALLRAPPWGCVNVHASVLPRWRGAAPVQRAMLAGDQDTGVTIMQMDEGLDTGDILGVAHCPILPDDTAGVLQDRLAALGARALDEALHTLAQGKLVPVPQDGSRATYARRVEKSEAHIDWRLPALELERQIRAFNPWPVAFTRWKNERLRLWRAHAAGPLAAAAPGTVTAATKSGIDVATGAGTLRLLSVQIPGARPVSAGDFFNAHPGVPGHILG